MWVDVSIEEIIRRGVARDRLRHGSTAEARHRYVTRYAAGQRLYVDEVDPAARADVVFDNADPATPVLHVREPWVHTFGTKP